MAQYLLDIQGNFLDATQSQNLEKYLTVNGHSMANPVLDANGNVDKDASRRVEVKFRLKDEEMIDELNQLLSSNDDTTADNSASTDTTNCRKHGKQLKNCLQWTRMYSIINTVVKKDGPLLQFNVLRTSR